jgi:hypothetical protein
VPAYGDKPEILKQPQIGKTAIVFSAYWYGGGYDGFGGPEAAGGLVRSYTYIDRQMHICYVGNWDGGRCDDQRLIPQKFCGSPASGAQSRKSWLAMKPSFLASSRMLRNGPRSSDSEPA